MAQDFSSNYISAPNVIAWMKEVRPGSKEKEPQALIENILWTVYPPPMWSTVSKYQKGDSESDARLMRVRNIGNEFSLIDHMYGEVKRWKEKVDQIAFNKTMPQLEKHMAQSDNPSGTILFGFIQIGFQIQFYHMTLPRGGLKKLNRGILHLKDDAADCQYWFDYNKPLILRFSLPTFGAQPQNYQQPPSQSSSSGHQSGQTSSALSATHYQEPPSVGSSSGFEVASNPFASVYKQPSSAQPQPQASSATHYQEPPSQSSSSGHQSGQTSSALSATHYQEPPSVGSSSGFEIISNPFASVYKQPSSSGKSAWSDWEWNDHYESEARYRLGADGQYEWQTRASKGKGKKRHH